MTEGANARGLRAAALLTAAWAVLLAVLCIVRNHHFLHDDTFITLRYARHLLQGDGPVWNTAGPRVEGFTSPLHLLLIAGVGALHVPLVTAARSVNIVFHLLLVVAVWISLRRTSGAVAAALGAGLTAAYWPLIVWDLGGLDAVPYAALVTAAVLVGLRYFEAGEARQLMLAGVLFGLALFMRLDAMTPALALFVCAAAFGPAPSPRRLRDAGVAALIAVAMVLPWEVFRITYFHDVLPNTFYAKLYGIPLAFRLDRGWKYWKAAAHDAPFLPLLAALSFAVLVIGGKATRTHVALAAVLGASVVSIYIIGGDYMPAYRLLCAVAPLMAVLVVRTLATLNLLTHPASALAISACFGILAALQMCDFDLNPRDRDPAGLLGEIEGKQLADRWPAGAVIGINFAGAFAFFADRYQYIDMLGLNDREIARRAPMPIGPVGGPTTRRIGHLKGDGVSVLNRAPDLLFLGGGVLAGDKYTQKLYGDWEMMRDPRFANYRPCRIDVPFTADQQKQLRPAGYGASTTLFLYQRKDLAWPCDPPTAADWARWATKSPYTTQPSATPTSASPQGT